jgi:citrate lyase beta subunit
MAITFDDGATDDLADRLRDVNQRLADRYPGEHAGRQPVHTVYGGAHLFRRDTAGRLGALALRAFETYAPDPATFADVVGAPDHLADTLHARVRGKLEREPVEDFRIDFEDGYGTRPDAEEDGHAEQAAREVAAGLAGGALPPFVGIRVKPFTEESRARAFRTTDVFVSTLVEATGGRLPPGFVVTLPKVRDPEEVAVLDAFLGRLESRLGLAPGAVPVELMIEVTQAILDGEGRVNVRRLVDAADGRCIAAHFGTYDYTASCMVTAAHQHMTHPACDFARHSMQVALGGTGVWLSDGATNIMPVGPHRDPATEDEQAENRRVVHDAWRLHVEHVRHSLVHAYYQGWDLHPAQLPTRYGAVYAFFLEGLDAAGTRLLAFVEQAAQATLVGDVFDDAATGQGLLNFFLRAVNCGAISEEEAAERTGLTLDELAGRSFPRILEARRQLPR